MEVNIDVSHCVNVTSLEHVTANVSFSYHRRGDVKVTLISPSQTASEMISFRDNDASDKGTFSSHEDSKHEYPRLGIKFFPFMSVHKWGEAPLGRWTLRIETREPENREGRKSALKSDPGELTHFGLRLYGSYASEQQKHAVHKRQESMAFVPSAGELEWIYRRELSIRQSPNVIQKRDYQNLMNKRHATKENESLTLFSSFRRAFGF